MKTTETAEEWLKENNCMNDLVHLKAKIKTSDAMQAYADQQVQFERNKVLDEAIVKVKNWYDTENEFPSLTTIVEELESLKIKQP